jgi:hypothetical protein
MKGRLGGQAAVTATAHKLARIVYLALKHGMAYVRQSQDDYDAQMKQKQIKAVKRKAPAGAGVDREAVGGQWGRPGAGAGVIEGQIGVKQVSRWGRGCAPTGTRERRRISARSNLPGEGSL